MPERHWKSADLYFPHNVPTSHHLCHPTPSYYSLRNVPDSGVSGSNPCYPFQPQLILKFNYSSLLLRTHQLFPLVIQMKSKPHNMAQKTHLYLQLLSQGFSTGIACCLRPRLPISQMHNFSCLCPLVHAASYSCKTLRWSSPPH